MINLWIDERVDFTNNGGTLIFDRNFTKNFMIGLTDFSSKKTVVVMDFKT